MNMILTVGLIILVVFIVITLFEFLVGTDSLYTHFLANPIIEDKINQAENCTIEFKNNQLTVLKGIFKKEVILSAPIADCEMTFDREYIPKQTEIIEKDKSVILRAVAGGVVLGPLGAIVGGMSGIGAKKDTRIIQHEKHITFVNIKAQGKELYFVVNTNFKPHADAIYRNFNKSKRAISSKG